MNVQRHSKQCASSHIRKEEKEKRADLSVSQDNLTWVAVWVLSLSPCAEMKSIEAKGFHPIPLSSTHVTDKSKTSINMWCVVLRSTRSHPQLHFGSDV